MGYVVQDGGLFPHLTAAENVCLMAQHLGWARERQEQRLTELGELVHLSGALMARYPGELSGGQKQRVGLMRALMLDPELLLLDEPLGALDPLVRAELQDDLAAIFATLGKSVVLVTHDLDEAAFFGHAIVLLRDGRIVQRGALDRPVRTPRRSVRDPLRQRAAPAPRRASGAPAVTRRARATGIVAPMIDGAIWRAICAAIAVILPLTSSDAAAASRELRVGSKSFTESVILGEIVTELERASGTPARHQAGFGGTRLVWDALQSGAIDVYPEYTGTLVEELLAGQRPAGQISSDVQSPDGKWITDALAARGIGLVGPIGFNNTYAIGVRRETAQRLGLHSISDLRAHPELRCGWSNEFMNRRDGWPALRARYQLAAADVKGLDHDLAYRAIAGGSIEAMDLYATDPEIRKYDLVVLEDDRHIFPRYDAVLLYRRDVATWAGAALGTLERLRGRIDAPAMTALNARVKLDHLPETEVAAAFLASTFGVAAEARPPGVARAILQRAAEHLWLVAISLLAAILVAIPLGVVAAARPRFGQALLGVVGIIQTVPSLALLVFMIPLLGIGALPAMVALFLYSLLPIVRNTHAGLESIPPALRESAEALGLPPGAILRRVSLPLASPLILAGIKSAAVINVGTATLGALIGAGGFGQPIFTGIRLDDVGLILQGAIPASLLALLIQGLFELVERAIVPKGLRLRRPA